MTKPSKPSKAKRRDVSASLAGYLPPLKSQPSEYDRAFAKLAREVNRCRYRGPRSNEPITDSYYWPLEISNMATISEAALKLVVAAERKADNEKVSGSGESE